MFNVLIKNKIPLTEVEEVINKSRCLFNVGNPLKPVNKTIFNVTVNYEKPIL